MTVYRIFDVSIVCPFPLTGLPVADQKSADWRVRMVAKQVPEREISWFHSWKGENGAEVMACGRHGEKYLLKITGQAYFTIDFGGQRISVWAENGCPEHTLAHFLIDQVIPRILGHLGRVVLHASAVVLADGQAVAFAGESGQGKSTLASAFLSAGCQLLCDDALLLENRGGRVYALASYPSLRLWTDSAQAVFEEEKIKGARYSGMAHYTDKQQLIFDGATDVAEPQWVKLSHLYLLEDNEGSGQVKITPAGGMASIMALIESLFTLDVVSGDSVRRSFESVKQVAGDVAVERIAYPREYEALSDVINSVEQNHHK